MKKFALLALLLVSVLAGCGQTAVVQSAPEPAQVTVEQVPLAGGATTIDYMGFAEISRTSKTITMEWHAVVNLPATAAIPSSVLAVFVAQDRDGKELGRSSAQAQYHQGVKPYVAGRITVPADPPVSKADVSAFYLK